jgi:5'-nucleotidase
MDGVVCDYTRSFLEAASKLGIPNPSNLTFFRMAQNFKAEYRHLLNNIDLEKGFYENLKPIEDSIDALKKLSMDERFEIFICTSPKKNHQHCVLEKYDWIKRHLGQYFVERIISTRDKTLIRGDFLIDDKAEVTGIEEKPSWEHLVFAQPYNALSQKRRVDWGNIEKFISESN